MTRAALMHEDRQQRRNDAAPRSRVISDPQKFSSDLSEFRPHDAVRVLSRRQYVLFSVGRESRVPSQAYRGLSRNQ